MASLKAPTIVIMDMDGTTVRHINPRLLNILERLDDFGYKVSRLFTWFKKGAKGPIDLNAPPPKKPPRLLVHRALHKFRRKPVEQIVEPCPGVYDFLDHLQASNIPLALVSNGLGKGYGHDVLRKFDLLRYFQTALFREDIRHSKPNPEPLLLALKRMDARPAKDDVIWYIGDRHKDVSAALAASKHLPCPIQPIAYGMNAAVAIVEKKVGQEHIIMSYKDMLNTVKNAQA